MPGWLEREGLFASEAQAPPEIVPLDGSRTDSQASADAGQANPDKTANHDKSVQPVQYVQPLPHPFGLMPGELSCETPPPPVGQLPVYAPFQYQPYQAAPQPMAPGSGQLFTPPAAAEQQRPSGAGWLDVLPPDGGPISDDFGLPRGSRVKDRVPNPIYVQSNNPQQTWELLADELTKYFPIQLEQRFEQAAGVLTEGRFETPWQVGATVLEPWKNDSVGAFNRWQSFLQTIRRRATVRVIPASGGYEIAVRVDKQLEDLPRPERASAGAASLRSDTSLPSDRLNPVDRVRPSARWIDIGRDEPLEQEMLRRFQARLTGN